MINVIKEVDEALWKQQEGTPGYEGGGSGRLIDESVLDLDAEGHTVSAMQGGRERCFPREMESSLADAGSLGGNAGPVTM